MRLKDKVALVTGTSPNIGGGIVEAWRRRAHHRRRLRRGQRHRLRAVHRGLGRPGAGPRVRCQRRGAGAGDCRRRAGGLRSDRHPGEQCRHLQQEGRAHHVARGVAGPDRRHPHRGVPVHQVRGPGDDRAAGAGRDSQHHLHRRPPGRTPQHRLQHRQVRPAELHPLRRNGAGGPPDPGQRSADRDQAFPESFERAARWGREARSPARSMAAMEIYRKGVPMQALPKPSDYGQAAAFLLSDDAAMITGVDLRVDAGTQSPGTGPGRRERRACEPREKIDAGRQQHGGSDQ